MKKLAQIVLAAAFAAAALPAFAQDAIGSLTGVNGTVMTSSNGGEFVSANNGSSVSAGDQLMIGQDSSASITFSNGATTQFTAPGTYTINLPAVVGGNGGAAGTTGGVGTAGTAGIILGAAVLGALGVDQIGDDVPPDHPVSQ